MSVGAAGFTPPAVEAAPLAAPAPLAEVIPIRPAPEEPPAPRKSGNTWCGSAGRRLARVFVAATDWGIERLGRRANEPEDEDVDDFGRALGEQLGRWFPDTELTPIKQMILSGALITGAMWTGAEKIEKKKPANTNAPEVAPSSPPGVPGAATISSTTPPLG